MSEPLALIFLGWLLMAVVMVGLWFIQKIRQDASLVDVAWSAGRGILTLFYAGNAGSYAPRRWLLGIMV
jgi:steroid 5-alpha reductase family enzyme